MFAVVNGYPCASTCDVAVARRNVDPRNPRNDPVKTEQLAEADVLKGKTPRDGLTSDQRVAPAEAVAAPAFDPNRRVDIYV